MMPQRLSLFLALLLVTGLVAGPADSGAEVGQQGGSYSDRLTVHRKGKPGQQEEEEVLAHELHCWPNVPQACLLEFI